jgi:hypothetical protein
MSLVPIGLTVALAAADDLLSSIFGRQLNIGGIFPDVVVEEEHLDELEITENPVEQNAAVTDHSYKRPVEVTIKAGFSNSSLAAGGDPNYVIEMYEQFLTLQASRQPFSIVTTKRIYSNMLIKRLQTRTDSKWSNATILEIACREVILVYTQASSVPAPANMSNPSLNAPPTNTALSQLQPGPNFNPNSAPFLASQGFPFNQ